MRYRTCFTLSIIYAVIHWTHIALSCVLLLQGWTPLSVRERAVLAEISAVGTVLRTFKDKRTEDGTYTAEFRIDTVYKGHELVSRVTRSVAAGNVYNISNFGNKTQCYADVEADGRYILFLTLYSDQLSAQYDDLFGAASVFDEIDQEEILAYLGWNHWSTWSPCNAGCSGGQQIRTRTCPKENVSSCIGVTTEVRTCNLFYCEGSHDLLTLMGARELPMGVTAIANRSNSYMISKQAKLSLSVSQIYQQTFPSTFSILARVKIASRKSRSYFFVVSDIHGKQQIALFLGKKLKFQYLGNNYVFRFDFVENAWHSIAISVDKTSLTLYADCQSVIKKRLRSQEEFLGTNLMISIGPYFSLYGGHFEGGVEQLVISSDPTVAQQQCGLILFDPKAVSSFYETRTPFKYTTAKPIVYGSEWSAWSACSTTCGQGLKTRALLCHAGAVSGDSCVPVSPLPTQMRICYLGPCQDCNPMCENGGVCLQGICRCTTNFTGSFCQNRICDSPCLNGGVCTSDGKCLCTVNYTGTHCQSPACNPACQNGGQCVQPGVCNCLQEFSGSSCADKKVTCHRGCYNGGHCVATNVCSCPIGFYGKRCQRANCEPKCQNGGVCVSPELCVCPHGYFGSFCQKARCNVQCMNGGTCVPPNHCKCPPLFFGRLCQKEVCRINCFNGGRCTNNKCLCPPGFEGKHCERRTCVFQQIQSPQMRTFRKVVHEEIPVPCGVKFFHTCFRTRLKYVHVTKDSYRTVYSCT